MEKLQLSKNKTLKLVNVLKWKISTSDENLQIEMELEKMKAFIRTHGGKQIGPLIRYLKAYINKDEDIDLDIVLMLQANIFIQTIREPYIMESTIRIPNCMYCRYIGPEDKLNFAFDKIQLTAFEEDIPLKGDSYTIFVDRDEENETIIADVFMERAD